MRDVSHEDAQAQSSDVEQVLGELGIAATDPRLLEVWNKIDRLDAQARDRVENAAHRMERRPIPASALTGEGIDALKAEIEERLAGSRARFRITLDGADGAGVSWLHRNTEVLGKTVADDGQVAMTVRVHPANAQLLQARFAGRVESAAHVGAGEAGQGRAAQVR